jgi:hypothetical protein
VTIGSRTGSVYRSFNLPASEQQVLKADLNCSESAWS